jgi:myo-inositol-1(or 4)-monophosphatase
MDLELSTITKQVVDISREMGIFLQEEIHKLQEKDIETKSLNNFVTYIDKQTEYQLVEKLKKILPNAGFIAEENDYGSQSEYNWIIDPLDGTTNYIHGVPLYCISIALQHKDEIIAGVIHEPNSQETFYAWKDSPAYLNGNTITVSNKKKLQDSLIATGFPYHDYSKMQEYMKSFHYLMKNSHGVRRLGSAAMDLAYVACGRYDGFYEYGLSPWDVAAGSLIVQQAGGKAGDFSGKSDYLFGKEIIASNSLIFNEFVRLMLDSFQE